MMPKIEKDISFHHLRGYLLQEIAVEDASL